MVATLHRPETAAANETDSQHEENGVHEAQQNAEDQSANDSTGSAASTEPPAPSPDELKRAHYEEIVALGKRVEEAKRGWDSLKVETTEAKKEYEGLLAAYLRLTRRDPMQRTLLVEPHAELENPPVVDDSWRKLEITVLDLAPAAVDKLFQAGVMTLGDLQDYWQSGKQLCDIKGIGEASDTAIRDAFSTYGVEHSEIFGEAPLAEGEGDAEPEDEEDDDSDDEESED